MIEFKPFCGVRPAKNKASTVTTKNLDYYLKEEISHELNNTPESFLNILKPTIEHKEWSDKEKYHEVRQNFQEFLKEGILLKDKKSYYIYEQEDANGAVTIGVIGIISIDNVRNSQIKKHENTLGEREEIFANHLKAIHMQADPVLLTFPENQSIELIMSMTTRHTPTLEFIGADDHTHRLWQVKDRLIMQQLKSAIEKLPSLYVADGHHRLGSLELYTDYMREQEPDFFGGEAFNYAMAVIVPGNFLKVKDYNRLIKDLNGYTPIEFLEKISGVFSVIEKEKPYYPSGKHHISLYLDGKFYALYVNQEYRGIPKALGELDTYLWEEHIMKPVLEVGNSRKSKRVKFKKGTGNIDGILAMKEMVDSGEFVAAFGFYPVSINDLILVADENKMMPPKSTFIEPKFLSALTTFDLTD